MLLEKPQNEAVETILTDCYNAGRESTLKALLEFHEKYPRRGIVAFLAWYKENSDNYDMKFKVAE
jgi:hypothetical protein